jgi:exonuclease SbcC
MRPVRLKLKGFTSFKDETTLSFEGLDRFAICGPTGAGKSSLLDAMTFALFADAPRVGTGSLSSLIALGCKSFAITLDFRVGEQLYRVTRARRRSGAGTDLFEKLSASNGASLLASGSDAVGQEIERLLGLNYYHFTQAVFLPQGKFAELLRARSTDRRELLNELLRLLVYERMQKRAGQEKDRYAAQRAQTERRLTEDFVGVTEAAQAELQRQQAEQQAAVEEVDLQLPELLACRDTARRYSDHTGELEEKEAVRANLASQQPAIERARQEADAAERATAIGPLLDEAKAAEAEQQRRQTELDQARADQFQCEAKYTTAKAELEQAVADAELLPSLGDCIQRLAEAVGKLQLRDRLAEQLKKQEQQHCQLAAEHSQNATEVVRLGNEVSALANELRQAEEERDATGYNAERHRKLDSEREAAVLLQGERNQLAAARAQVEQLQRTTDNADREVLDAQQQKQDAEDALAEARRLHDNTERALHAAQREHSAAHLREALHVGELCPVCRQAVAHLPNEPLVPALEELRRTLEAAAKPLPRLEKAVSLKTAAAAAAISIATTTRHAVETTRAEAERRQRTVGAEERRLEVHLASLVDPRADVPIEERVIIAARDAAARQKRHGDASGRVQSLQNRLSNKEKDQESLNEDVARLERELKTLADGLAADRAELSRVQQEIRIASGTDDPAAETRRIQQQVDDLRNRFDQTKAAESTASQALSLAQNRVNAGTREADAAATRARHTLARATAALAQAGFDTTASARAALRTSAQMGALRSSITAHETALHAVLGRISELERELGGRRVSLAARRQAEQEYDAVADRRQKAMTEFAVLSQKHQTLEFQLERARMLRNELAELVQQHHLYDQLARDLRSDRFFAFLLEETLTDLVQGASAQLGRLTCDRYGLAFEQERIFVLDHDNAGECRSIETLSGGETFLASLALALALSDQVQRIAGAVHLDCLFIDEGFGTLDPETLRTVSDTIRNLQVGGRIVGIVTHVPDLKDEFEQQVLVCKAGGTSQVAVVCV